MLQADFTLFCGRAIGGFEESQRGQTIITTCNHIALPTNGINVAQINLVVWRIIRACNAWDDLDGIPVVIGVKA